MSFFSWLIGTFLGRRPKAVASPADAEPAAVPTRSAPPAPPAPKPDKADAPPIPTGVGSEPAIDPGKLRVQIVPFLGDRQNTFTGRVADTLDGAEVIHVERLEASHEVRQVQLTAKSPAPTP